MPIRSNEIRRSQKTYVRRKWPRRRTRVPYRARLRETGRHINVAHDSDCCMRWYFVDGPTLWTSDTQAKRQHTGSNILDQTTCHIYECSTLCKYPQSVWSQRAAVTQIFQVDLRTCIKPTLAPTQPAGPYHYISSKNRQQISTSPQPYQKCQSFLSYALQHYQ